MAAGCDTGVVMQTMRSKDVREHLFQALLRHLEIRTNVVQLSVPSSSWTVSTPCDQSRASLLNEIAKMSEIRQEGRSLCNKNTDELVFVWFERVIKPLRPRD